eukprot:11784793-Alexandrium_andersonii.AAC.1
MMGGNTLGFGAASGPHGQERAPTDDARSRFRARGRKRAASNESSGSFRAKRAGTNGIKRGFGQFSGQGVKNERRQTRFETASGPGGQ